MRLVGGAIEEEDVARADRARKKDRRGRVEERAGRAEGVVGDDELGLAAGERDRACRAGERECASRGGEGDRECDICPVNI